LGGKFFRKKIGECQRIDCKLPPPPGESPGRKGAIMIVRG
jgi:hypothetical protein